MQLPNTSTTIPKCLDLAIHASRLLGKFPDNARLVELAQRMSAGIQALEAAELAYTQAWRTALLARIDCKYADYESDRCVRRTLRMAEMSDGRKSGRIATRVFPSGSNALIKLQGASQIQAMRDLEARMAGLEGVWPEAAAVRAAVEQHRQRYEQALEARDAAERNIRDLRAARDAAKQSFLDLYATVANLVRAEFPRDRESQDLFFDTVRGRVPGGVVGDEPPYEPGDEPGDEPDSGVGAQDSTSDG